MTSSPKAIKQELVKEVIVPYYLYQTNSQEDNLVSEEINVKSGDILTFYTAEPCYSFKSTLNGSSSNVSIVSEGSYCVSVKVAVTGKYRLEIFAHRYKIVQKQVLKELHIRGKTVKWENPLIDNFSMANDLANWIADYYESGIEYEYETRGNPEIDVNDIIYQENEFYKNMRVTVCRHRINFNNSFSGKITTRRQGE